MHQSSTRIRKDSFTAHSPMSVRPVSDSLERRQSVHNRKELPVIHPECESSHSTNRRVPSQRILPPRTNRPKRDSGKRNPHSRSKHAIQHRIEAARKVKGVSVHEGRNCQCSRGRRKDETNQRDDRGDGSEFRALAPPYPPPNQHHGQNSIAEDRQQYWDYDPFL